MRAVFQIVAGVLALCVVYAVVRYASDLYMGHVAEHIVDDHILEARKKHPDQLVSAATRELAVSRSKETLASETDVNRRRELAARQFYGFFFLNSRARPEFCRAQGVDISSFKTLFEQEHVAQLNTARKVANSGMTEDAYYHALESALLKVISQDMQDIATVRSVSLKGACQWFVDDARDIAERLYIATANPAVQKTLMGD